MLCSDQALSTIKISLALLCPVVPQEKNSKKLLFLFFWGGGVRSLPCQFPRTAGSSTLTILSFFNKLKIAFEKLPRQLFYLRKQFNLFTLATQMNTSKENWADAKSTNSDYLGPTFLGPIMSLSDLN